MQNALAAGVRSAQVEGGWRGVISGLIYLAEAVLFFIGTSLIANDEYTYLQMAEVLNSLFFR